MCPAEPSWWDPPAPADDTRGAVPADGPLPPEPAPGELRAPQWGLVMGGAPEAGRLAGRAVMQALPAAAPAAGAAVGISAAEATLLTVARSIGLLGLVFMPPPQAGAPPARRREPADDQRAMDAGTAPRTIGLPGPNGETEEDPRFVSPDAGVTRGVLRPLVARSPAGDDSRPRAAAAGEGASTTGSPGAGDGGVADAAVDLARHVGREGHERGVIVPGDGAPKLLVGHAGYTVGGLLGDRVLQVDRARVTLLRDGVTMPTLLTNALLSGDWTGTAWLEKLEAEGRLTLRGRAYLDKARENGGMHPYMEGAAGYFAGAVPDYRVRAPAGLRLHANQYSVSDARFATVSELLPPGADLEVSGCTAVRVAGTREAVLSLHDYPPLQGRLDLPGGYWVNPATGERSVDRAIVERWKWRHDFDLAPDLTPDMSADEVATALQMNREQMEAALIQPTPLFDNSCLEHPLSADPAVADILAAGVPRLDPANSAQHERQVAELTRNLSRVQAVKSRTERYIEVLEQAGMQQPVRAARDLHGALSEFARAGHALQHEVESRRIDLLLDNDWELD